ncbi:hypothetical protein PMNALOAF_3738 [Methylobacterium adhaesivum]|uniref:Uncharacterized protein n=1 Tax=Methylobacterium adhaesivum TaxID=333297 RepID=A0ABT8BJE5_9HYPH|nr:hypothetical protein [Methylobacterium adhaesivum]MDN3591869.1 hypothetical protein [Methylobacterium adhaesivum]GJD32465.1 hypothetical protein PMNALOAF_3738 [Methylobacterium adhaesivum]
MNKTIALLSAAAILAASAAVAQPAPPPAGPRPGPEAGAPPPPPPPGGPHGGPRGPRGGPDAPPPPKAAHFRLERGDTALDVKCAADEPMRACADIALQLLDKLAALPAPPPPAQKSRD